jgi:LmbE family N-acetylglucosaminyl deacetylase
MPPHDPHVVRVTFAQDSQGAGHVDTRRALEIAVHRDRQVRIVRAECMIGYAAFFRLLGGRWRGG